MTTRFYRLVRSEPGIFADYCKDGQATSLADQTISESPLDLRQTATSWATACSESRIADSSGPAAYRSEVAEFEYSRGIMPDYYVSVIWRRKSLVLVSAIVAALVALILTLLQTPMYRADAEVLVRIPPTAVGSAGAVMNPQLLENELQTASGSAVQSQVHDIVGDEPRLSAAARNTEGLRFSATSSNADAAAFAANTYAAQYIDGQATILVEGYEADIAAIEEQLGAIGSDDIEESDRAESERELEDLRVSIQLAQSSGSTLIVAAVAPDDPYEPNLVRAIAVALGVGLLLGLAAAFVVEHFDTELDDDGDVERTPGLPVLAVVPHQRDRTEGTPLMINREEPFSAVAEAYRDLWSRVEIIARDRSLKLVQVTSPRAGDGRTTAAGNLAVAAARSGQHVLLIDCDLRTPSLQNLFSLSNEAGFTSVLRDETTLPRVARSIPDEGNLLVVTSGPLPTDPTELFAGESLQRAFETLSDGFDLVIIDTPPVLVVPDALVLAAHVDGVILVASAKPTDRGQLISAIDQLIAVRAPMLGTVLNSFVQENTEKHNSHDVEPALRPDAADSKEPTFDLESPWV